VYKWKKEKKERKKEKKEEKKDCWMKVELSLTLQACCPVWEAWLSVSSSWVVLCPAW